MSEPAAPDPGWYADPWRATGLRWWDGSAWTAHAADGPPVQLAPDLPTNRTWADRAAIAFLVLSAVLAFNAFALPVIFAGYFDAFGDVLDDSTTGTVELPAGVLLGGLALNVVGLFGTAALVVICVWTHHATTTARRLGRRTTHSPGWAAAGWFVPIVNYWFPYQAVRDLVPEGHPLRAKARAWWAYYLGAAFSTIVPIGLSAFSLPVALAAALVPAALAIAAGLGARRIATGVADEHEATAATATAISW